MLGLEKSGRSTWHSWLATPMPGDEQRCLASMGIRAYHPDCPAARCPIGFDAALDLARGFTRSDGGITVVPRDAAARLPAGPERGLPWLPARR